MWNLQDCDDDDGTQGMWLIIIIIIMLCKHGSLLSRGFFVFSPAHKQVSTVISSSIPVVHGQSSSVPATLIVGNEWKVMSISLLLIVDSGEFKGLFGKC